MEDTVATVGGGGVASEPTRASSHNDADSIPIAAPVDATDDDDGAPPPPLTREERERIDREVQERVQEQLRTLVGPVVVAETVVPGDNAEQRSDIFHSDEEEQVVGKGHSSLASGKDHRVVQCLSWRFQRKTLVCVVLVLLVVVVVGAVVGGVMGGQQSPQGSSNDSNGNEAAEEGQTPEPTLLSIQQVLEDLVGNKIHDPGTTHQKAKTWLLQSNPNLRRERTDELISQRYLMALLYFSMSSNGEVEWSACNPDFYSECDVSSAVCAAAAAAEKEEAIGAVNVTSSKRWLSCAHECEWFGVHCSKEDDFVDEIRLANNSLNGALPPDLAKLPHLRVLQLSHNSLKGSIPSEYDLLSGSLRELDLQGNRLNESIPEDIYNLTLLRGLNLAENNLTGSLSTRIGMLTSLEALFVQDNYLSGQVPWKELSALANLTEISLQYNRLSGTVLPETCDLFFEDPGKGQRVSSLVADCDGDPAASEGNDDALPQPALSCSCCTDCCNAIRRECRANN